MAFTSTALLLLILASTCQRGVLKDVFASSAHLEMLNVEEGHLIEAVKSYISHERVRIQSLERLLSEVELGLTNSGNGIDSTSHPVDVFRLINRFTTTWKVDIFPLLFDSSSSENVTTLLQSVESLIPEDEDYEGAMVSLIRIQHTYQLPIDHLINGTVLDRKTKPMSQQMAVDVAAYALHRKLYDDALNWLNHAWNHLIPPLVPMQELCHVAAKALSLRGDRQKASEYAEYAHELDPGNSRYPKVMPEQIDDEGVPWSAESEKNNRLCQEFLLENNARNSNSAEAPCVLERGRVVPFMRMKVEFLNRSPDVVLFHDFITDNEANILTELAASKIDRALVYDVAGDLSSKMSESRLGKIVFESDDSSEPLIRKLSRRAMDATRLDTKHPYGEYIQLSNYGIGGHFDAHWDHNPTRDSVAPEDVEGFNNKTLDRIATLMLYLNDVEAGGATIFPELDLGTRPVKNAAIFWYNLKRSGYTEIKSKHAGCPVLIGGKWVANKWIRERGQEFLRPCRLTIDE